VPVKKLIKQADLICAYCEATQIAGFEAREAETFFGAPPTGLVITVAPEPPADAQRAFLARFDALYHAVHGEPHRPTSRNGGDRAP
jgi:hypothetical protein